nr:hypothetical protein [Tanacetum cinerariifolium]
MVEKILKAPLDVKVLRAQMVEWECVKRGLHEIVQSWDLGLPTWHSKTSWMTFESSKKVNTAHDVSVASSQGQPFASTDADDVMRGQFARECRALRNQGNINRDNTRRVVPVKALANALVHPVEVHNCSKECLQSYQTLQKQYDQQRKILNKANLEIIAYQLGLESLKARIVVHQKNEAVFEEDIAFLKYNVKIRPKDKTGLGYDGQLNERDLNYIHINKSKVFESASDGSVNKSEEDNNQVNDRLDDSVFKSTMSETVTSVHETETTTSKTSKESMEKPKTVSCNKIKPSASLSKALQEQHHQLVLPDYQEINGRFVAFGGSPKGDKEINISDDKDADEVPGKGDEGVSKLNGIDDQERTDSKTGIFDDVYDDREVGAEADTNNLELLTVTLVDLPNGKKAIGTKWVYRDKKDKRGIVVRNKARLVAQGYTQEKGIDYDEVFAPIARIEAIMLFFAYALFMGFIVYQMDVKSAFLYGTIEEEIFRRGTIDKTLFIKKDIDDVQKIPNEFYGGAYFLLRVAASTPMEPNKALIKDAEAEDVDGHLYRSMIGSLMYLTASRPDIMFVVCACARFQVQRFHIFIMGGGAEAQTRFEAASKQSNDPPLSKVNTLGSEKDDEAASTGVDVRHGWAVTTISSLDARQGNDRVLVLETDLQQTKKVYSTSVTKLIMMVKKLEKIVKSNKARGRTKIVVSDDEKAEDCQVHKEASSFNVKEWEDVQATIEANEELALRIQAEEREKYFEAEKARLLQLKRLSFDELKNLFEATMKKVKTFTPIESDVNRTIPKIADESLKRVTEEELKQESSKRQKIRESLEPREKEDDALTQEDLQQIMMIILVEEVYVKALQVKYLIDLVKERFSTTEPTDDKEKELWVELKRLFKPDNDNTLWKLQKYMHDPLTTACKAVRVIMQIVRPPSDLTPLWWLSGGSGVYVIDKEVVMDLRMC